MNHTRMFKILWAVQPAKFFLILSVSTLISLSSCNKSSVIGLDVQPENDLIDAAYQDTLTLLTQTVKEDSLRTDATLISNGAGLIGKYWDPVFGQVTSSVYSQLLLYANAPTFGTNPVVDSVRLTLLYSNSYGKKSVPRQNQLLNVYQLNDDLDYASIYFSNQKKSFGQDLTTTNGFVFRPRPSDSIVIYGKTKLAPGLRIPIKESFGQSILDKQNATELSDNINFLKFIKGIYITTENTMGIPVKEGNIVNFNMSYSSLNIYYHNSTEDSLSLNLSLAGARFMHFDHQYVPYADPDLQKQLVSGASAQNEILYVQSLAGLKAKIKIPNLLTWAKKEFIAINKAELEIKSISTKKDTFAVVPSLNLWGIKDDGTIDPYPIPDATEGTAYFGGIFDTATNSYRFMITRQIQQMISGSKPNNGLYITSGTRVSAPTRVVLGGGSATLNGGTIPNNYQMKLKITYTKLK